MESNSRAALQTLLDKHSNRLFKQALAATGDRQEAREITIQAFRHVYGRLEAGAGIDGDAAVQAEFDSIMAARRAKAAPAQPAPEKIAADPPSYYVPPVRPAAQPAPAQAVPVESAPVQAAPAAEKDGQAKSVFDDEDVEYVLPRRTNPVAAAAVVILAAIVVWAMIGVLCGYGIIPMVDLGYEAIGFFKLPIF